MQTMIQEERQGPRVCISNSYRVMLMLWSTEHTWDKGLEKNGEETGEGSRGKQKHGQERRKKRRECEESAEKGKGGRARARVGSAKQMHNGLDL